MNFSWSTIPLGTYAAIDALSRANVSDVMQRDVSLLSLLTGKTEEYFMELPFPELTALRKAMHEFLAKDPEEKYHPEFECNGRRYKVSQSAEEFNGAQLEGISALQLNDDNYARNSHFATAILCQEIPTEINVWTYKSIFKWRNRYEIQTVPPLSIKERAADFEKHLPASIALGINSFFFLYSQALFPLVLEKVNNETCHLKQKLNTNQKNQPRRSGLRK